MQNYNRLDLGRFGVLAYGNPAVTPSEVAATQVRTASEMASFITKVEDSIQSERNETLSAAYQMDLSRKRDWFKGAGSRMSNQTIADTFGYLRDFASQRSAPQTSLCCGPSGKVVLVQRRRPRGVQGCFLSGSFF